VINPVYQRLDFQIVADTITKVNGRMALLDDFIVSGYWKL